MLRGHVDRLDLEGVGGWAANTDVPARTLAVVIEVDGDVYATIRCDVARPDLAQMGLYGDGRHGFELLFSPPLDPRSSHGIVVRFEDSGVIVPNGIKAFSKDVCERQLTPILVTAAGRSGTTVLMTRLGVSPAICVAGSQPFEVRHLSYYALAQKVLTASALLKNSTHPDKLEGSGLLVGHNPFFSEAYANLLGGREQLDQFISDFVRARTISAFREIIDQYYKAVAKSLNKENARFFAEKSLNLERNMREFARSMHPQLREILLVRDPRDLVCSHMSYFSSDKDKAVNDATNTTLQVFRILEQKNKNTLVIKYEDLILRPSEMDAQIAGFLGIDPIGIRSRDVEEKIFIRHGTAKSPRESIGRWRKEMSSAEQLHYNKTWIEFLRKFDYSLE